LVGKISLDYSTKGDDKMEIVDAVLKPKDVNYLDLHTKNFIEAIKKNDPKMLNTPIDKGSLAAINAQMGNIAYRTGTKVDWDMSSDSKKMKPLTRC